MRPRQVPGILPDECVKHLLDAKSAMLELRQISLQQPAVEETLPWSSLTKEKQRELQLLANSARLQVQKSVRDLTSEIRQLRQALDTSQRNGENLASVERTVAQDSFIPDESPRSDSPGSHLQRHLAPEALQGNSVPKAKEPKEIPALSKSVAQSGQSKTASTVVGHSLNLSPAKEPSTVHRDRAGHPTVASQQRSNGRSKQVETSNRQRMRESVVARKCEACRRQVLEPGTHGETGKRQSSDHHSSTEAQPLQKRSVVCAELVGCSPRETSSPTAEWVSSSNRTIPRQQNGLLDVKDNSGPSASLSRKQNQGLHENTNWETYLEKRGREEIQEQNQYGWQRALEGILHRNTEHRRTEKRSRDIHRRMEKRFAEAVEKYFVKLMIYEDKVFQRWFSPKEESKSLERGQFTPSEEQYIQQEWFPPDKLHHFKEQKHSPKVIALKVQQESSIPVIFKCFKHSQLNSADKMKCLRKQRKCNGDAGYHPKIPVCSSRGDKKLDVLTSKQVDIPEPRQSMVENLPAQRLSQSALVAVDQKNYKKTRVTIWIAESLLDEALTQLAGELRTWCGKVIDHLIDGELGTRTI